MAKSYIGCYLSLPVTRECRTLVVDEDMFEEGYDSDGQIGPFFDAVAHEVSFENYEEDAHQNDLVPVIQTEAQPVMQEPPDPSFQVANLHTPLTESEIHKMKVKEL
jgi:hypothetical protein